MFLTHKPSAPAPHVYTTFIHILMYLYAHELRLWIDRWIFADVGMMMMQTGMVKGNTAYSSYLDGTPASDFLPYISSRIRARYPSVPFPLPARVPLV